MKRVRILIPILLLACTSLKAQEASWFLPKALGAVDGLMRMGRIANAGNSGSAMRTDLILTPSLKISDNYGNISISSDYAFINYLNENNLKSDALTLMCSDLYMPSDTLSYMRGATFYKYKYVADAIPQFAKVPSTSAFYDRSTFLGIAMMAYCGQSENARAALESYTGEMSDVKYMQNAGLSLLEKDTAGAREYLGMISPDAHYSIQGAKADLLQQAQWMDSFKPKSPAVGGLLSTVVPGLGKIYAGRTGEGIMAFLTVGSFAAITAENWVHYGIKDWKTILFGTIGSIFYISNIYGSCVSVKVYNNNAIAGYEAAVLVDIHIPLSNIFR